MGSAATKSEGLTIVGMPGTSAFATSIAQIVCFRRRAFSSRLNPRFAGLFRAWHTAIRGTFAFGPPFGHANLEQFRQVRHCRKLSLPDSLRRTWAPGKYISRILNSEV